VVSGQNDVLTEDHGYQTGKCPPARCVMLNMAACICEWKGRGKRQVTGAKVNGPEALFRSPRKPTIKASETSAWHC
jgi:hypothetical protein